MSERPRRAFGWRPDEPVTVVCAAMYAADLVPAHAFVFRVPSTDTRFTVYAEPADRYLVGDTYHLTLQPADSACDATGSARADDTGGGS